VRAFRDTWELGIHSYLSYLRDRLVVARELLSETGSVFVQIGDENEHLVRSLMDEVMGAENFVSVITFKKTSGAGSFAGGTNVLASISDYIVWYAKDRSRTKYRQLYLEKEIGGAGGGAYTAVEESDGRRRRAKRRELESGQSSGRFFRPSPLTSETVREAQTTVFEVELDGKMFLPRRGGWKTNRVGMDRLLHAQRLMRRALPPDDHRSRRPGPRPHLRLRHHRLRRRAVGPPLDHHRHQPRRSALARTRLMAAKYPYYLLADSPRVSKEAEVTGQACPPDHKTDGDIRKGFVYKRVPHVTLKSIANNPDIREGMTPRGDRRRHRPPRRHRDALRPALRGQQAGARVRPVHGREPLAAPRAGRGRGAAAAEVDGQRSHAGASSRR
jgi:adenine-specific DNA-methyltransferase